MDREFGTIDYRRHELEKNLDMIRNAVNGREKEYPIFREDGTVDPEKLEQQIREMWDIYVEYLAWEDRYKAEKRNLGEEEKEFFHHFLYLAMLAPEIYRAGMYYFDYYQQGRTFLHILRAARRIPVYDRKEALYLDESVEEENAPQEGWETFYGELNSLLHQLVGYQIQQTYDLPVRVWDPNHLTRYIDKEEAETEDGAEAAAGTDTEDIAEPVEKAVAEGVSGTAEGAEEKSKADTEETSESDAAQKSVDPGTEKDSETGGGVKAETVDITELTVDSPDLPVEDIVEGGRDISSLFSHVKVVPMEEASIWDREIPGYEDFWDEEEEDAPPPTTPEEWERDQEEQDRLVREELEEADETFAAWKNTLPDAEQFFVTYLEFRRLALLPENIPHVRRLTEEVGTMIDVWLYVNGYSAFSLGRAYGLVGDRLENSVAHLRKDIARARRLS